MSVSRLSALIALPLFAVSVFAKGQGLATATQSSAGKPARTRAAKGAASRHSSEAERGFLAVQPIDSHWEFHALAVTAAAPNAVTPESVLKEHPEIATWRAATVPGTVHTDLAAAGVIPPPFVGDNEKRLQWIGLVDWEYRAHFAATEEQLSQTHAELVFEGLDTFADVSLNGKPLLHTENMFRSYTADAKPLLQVGDNTLTIVFHSPINTTAPGVAKLPYILPGTGYEPLDPEHGVYPVGQYQRKAGYHYGWDWGPRFVASGVFRPIHLDTLSGDRIRSLDIGQTSVTADRVLANAQVEVHADTAGPATLVVGLTDPEGKDLPVRTLPVELEPGANPLTLPLRLDRPKLWWPAGYGPQSRYTVTARLLRGGRATASTVLKTGFRSVELRRKPDEWGVSFEFVINGIPVFAKGANLVPLDSFPPATTDAKKRDILTSARDANLNMLRIWGGGFYETDSFYDLCDELGLMVWHDFMFGGGMVPGDKDFETSVKIEADQQVARLANHPAITLWNGNNEVETAWNNWEGQKKFIAAVTPDQRERVWQDYVVMFRDILKSSVAAHGNRVPYWPSSPSANFEDSPGNARNGDVHSWGVWSAGAPPSEYTKETPRFISEFGFQSLPDLRTMQSVVGAKTDLDSPEIANHERFAHGFTRMREYLAGNYLPARDFPSTIYLSQLLQAEAIRLAVDHARLNRPRTMGTLYWQLDDCWPVASWASLDYFGRWKALHYWARHFYAPIAIAPELEDASHTLRLHLVSDDTRPHSATLRIRLMHFDGTLLGSPQADQRLAVTLAPLASTPVPPIALTAIPGFDAKNTVAVVTLEPAAGGPDALAGEARSNLALDGTLVAADAAPIASSPGARGRRSEPRSAAVTRAAVRRSASDLTLPDTTSAAVISTSAGSPPYPLIPSAETSDAHSPTTLAERTIYFAGAKELSLTQPLLSTKITRDATGYTVELSTDVVAPAVEISFGSLNWKLSDNYVDLLPHEPRRLHLTTTATQDQLETALHTRSLYSATTH